MSQNSSEGLEEGVVEKQLNDFAKPPKYNVVLLNDDYTTMEFVVEILKVFFGKTEEQAHQITMDVHHKGKGICGTFTRDIAMTKSKLVNSYSERNQQPLKTDVQESE
jgi:ATP-dependent Clp protease adaptor protein ClpS